MLRCRYAAAIILRGSEVYTYIYGIKRGSEPSHNADAAAAVTTLDAAMMPRYAAA